MKQLIFEKKFEKGSPEYIVAIGASVGKLDALDSLFSKMPLDTGIAFVIFQHFSPDYKSLMDALLAMQTNIPIHVEKNEMLVLQNRIYLLAPKKEGDNI